MCLTSHVGRKSVVPFDQTSGFAFGAETICADTWGCNLEDHLNPRSGVRHDRGTQKQRAPVLKPEDSVPVTRVFVLEIQGRGLTSRTRKRFTRGSFWRNCA